MSENLDNILLRYQDSFNQKKLSKTKESEDVLMGVFGINQEIKETNKQFWGRELGMCWQYLVDECFKNLEGYGGPLKINSDEPADLRYKEYAIDTKYRIGSGDSGTLKKFKQYGPLIKSKGYKPIMLFLREDNLPAAITALNSGGWEVRMGDSTFEFIKNYTGFDLFNYLLDRKLEYKFN